MTSAASIAACKAGENQAPVGKGMSVATVKKAPLSRSAQASSCREHHRNSVVSSLDDLYCRGCALGRVADWQPAATAADLNLTC